MKEEPELIALVDVNRQITVLVVEGVEESHLLMTMSRIFDIVDIQLIPTGGVRSYLETRRSK
jgi:hypothetical protein